jgi:hypothetical protein
MMFVDHEGLFWTEPDGEAEVDGVWVEARWRHCIKSCGDSEAQLGYLEPGSANIMIAEEANQFDAVTLDNESTLVEIAALPDTPVEWTDAITKNMPPMRALRFFADVAAVRDANGSGL